MSRWKEFIIEIDKVSERDKYPAGKAPTTPTETMVDLDQVETYFRSMDENDELTKTLITMKSGDSFSVLTDYADFKKIMQTQ